MSVLLKRSGGYAAPLVLLAACAPEPPLPPTPERAGVQGYDMQAAYNKPYKVKGKTYYPLLVPDGYRERGIASWYGAESGNHTAMGSRFSPNQFTAAHKTLPLPCRVKVTNLRNGRSIVVTVNDRGPFQGKRLIDLSQTAAKHIGIKGVAQVEVEYLSVPEDDS